MIAKGNLHGDGARLARYILTGEKGEIAELVGTRGLECFGRDPVEAFANLDLLAAADTKCARPFFHAQTRLAPGEQLSREQWLEVADREEKRLGFAGQARIVGFHRNLETGETHLHVGWFRVDLETRRAIDPGLFKNNLKELSRQFEKKFGLKEVSNQRKPDNRTRAPERNEVEESRRLKTDLKAIRNTILDCFEKSDGGKAFQAALGAHGMMLANGDRRDCFVVIDLAGGQHALNKKITGLTLAEIRNRLGDLNRTQLPGVEKAQAQQQVREAAREARHRADRAEIERAAQRAMQEAQAAEQRRADGAPESRVADEQPDGTEKRPEDMRPLGKTAGEIRTAWALTRVTGDLQEALAAHGIALAEVSAEEARQSERTAAFAKAIGGNARQWREGEIVAVDGRGDVYRLDPRTTGDERSVIEARIGGTAGLLSVTATKEVMLEAAKAAWLDARRAEQERVRPASWMEARLAEYAATARLSGAVIQRDPAGRRVTRLEALADRLKPADARVNKTATVFGAEAFAARLEKAGITIARATATDLPVLDALRRDEELEVSLAELREGARKSHRFAALEVGELAAVTRNGNVHRINPDKLGDAKRWLPDQPPSVIEARALAEINREQTAELWAARREETLRAAAERSEKWDAKRDRRALKGRIKHAVRETLADAVTAAGKARRATGGTLTGVAKVTERLFGFLGDLVSAPPPLTPDQADRAERVAEENREARADQAARQERTEAQDWLLAEQRRQQQPENFAAEFGRPPSRDRARDDEDGRGRERER